MSLVYWSPMTDGTIKNQGTIDIQALQSENSHYSSALNGKLGKCIKTTSSSSIDTSFLGDWVGQNSNTLAGWFYFPSSEIKTVVDASSNPSSGSPIPTGNLLGYCSYAGITLMWYSDKPFTKFIVCMTVRTGSALYTANCNFTANNLMDKWVHIAGIWDNTNLKIGLYINGEQVSLVNITSQTFSSLHLYINKNAVYGGNGPACCIPFYCNDLRIYKDEILTDKQIKYLSQGLVLHYPLSDKYIESTTNLITTEDCLSSTCYNGATSKYGYGTNTDIYKTVTTYDGRKGTKVYMGTSGNSCYPYVYINNMYTSDGTNSPAYKTLSFDYYGTIGNYLIPYKLGSGNGTATYKVTCQGIKTTGSNNNSVSIPVTINKWNHIEITFHGTTQADSQWGYIRIGNGNHTSNTSNFWFFANMQLETKDHATGYAGVNGTRSEVIVYDTSGYSNNGTINGELSVSDDSPRYDISTEFNGSDSGILIDNLYLSNIINTAVTYSFWIKPSGENGARSVYFGSYSGNSWSIEKTAGNLIRGYWNGNPDVVYSGATITDNTWQHICITKNGTSDIKVYINGILKATSSTAHNNISFPTTYRIGRDTRSGDGTPYKGLMSDFRIYATALSADEIKYLYDGGDAS